MSGAEPRSAQPPISGRIAEVRRLTEEMDHAAALSEGHFNALGMLVTDASLAGDGPALQTAQDGLQWLFRRYAGMESPDTDELEHRGRLLGLIDSTHWALRRLPSALQLSLDPTSHGARFLVEVARRPGLSNQEVADALGIDETEVSRVGRRLLAAGVLWRRRQWRRNVWDVTPRGHQYLTASGLRLAAPVPPAETLVPAADITLAYAVGVKVLPRLLVGVVTDRDAEVLNEMQRALPGPLAVREAGAELVSFVRELLDGTAEVEADRHRTGVGIEIGGHVSTGEGKVVCAPHYAPHGDWTGLSLAAELERELGLPVVIENDANALAEFEHAFGAHVGVGSSATVVLDEGVGCGLAVDGRVLHGAGGSAGEIGHVVVSPQGRRCRCGARGCLETVAGTVAITEAISDRTGRKVTDLGMVSALVEDDNKAAAETVRQAGRAFGRALSAVLNLVNPEQLVYYGPTELVSEATHASARCFMTNVRRSIKEHAFSNSGRCGLVAKPYPYRVGAQAAAAVALLRRVPVNGAAA